VDAQIQKVRDAGIEPTHLDSHKHVHMLAGIVWKLLCGWRSRHSIRAPIRICAGSGNRVCGRRLAREETAKRGGDETGRAGERLKLLARDASRTAEGRESRRRIYFCGIAQTGELTLEGLKKFVMSLPEGTTNLMLAIRDTGPRI